MKALALCALLCVSAAAFAKEQHQMSSAKVISQDIGTERGGAVVAPIGTMLVGVPIENRINVVVIEHTNSQGKTFRGTIRELFPRHALVLTVNGTVQYYMEKGKIIIADSEGKKHKFAIIHSEEIGEEP